MHRLNTPATKGMLLFVVLCLALAILSGKQRTSVMEDVAAPIPVESSEVTDPVMQPAADDAVPATEVAPDATEETGGTEDGE